MLKPLIPANLVWLALALGAALFAGSEFAPAPYNLLCAGLGSVALYLAGKGWRMPAWAVGKPLLPTTLVPLALGLVQALNALGGALPASVQPFVAPLTGLLALLAGVVEPEPVKAVAAPPADAAGNTLVPEAGPVVQVAATCSVAQAARGEC
ncbi:hypothetical protein [Corallococcus silvisoli]|uniref:hypothetical protein n=1 Tax=Corallococcus silvisoli TaxID=2697031 RepID=UPI00191BD7BB|nr:hypothetical protein [Corallococcus silvisoli]